MNGVDRLHADAVALLDAWPAPDRTQQALRDRFLSHLEREPEGVWRDCVPAHLTAGVLVVDRDGEHVLLNLHKKARRWFAFGGHCEPGDRSVAQVARREGLEESGLAAFDLDPVPVDLDEHSVPFCGDSGTVQHLDVRFTARVERSTRHLASAESLAVRWWPVAALPEDLEDEMRVLISRSLARWA